MLDTYMYKYQRSFLKQVGIIYCILDLGHGIGIVKKYKNVLDIFKSKKDYTFIYLVVSNRDGIYISSEEPNNIIRDKILSIFMINDKIKIKRLWILKPKITKKLFSEEKERIKIEISQGLLIIRLRIYDTEKKLIPFQDEKPLMSKEPRLKCNNCHQDIKNEKKIARQLPGSSWYDLIDCWSCHDYEFSSIFDKNICKPEEDKILFDRLYVYICREINDNIIKISPELDNCKDEKNDRIDQLENTNANYKKIENILTSVENYNNIGNKTEYIKCNGCQKIIGKCDLNNVIQLSRLSIYDGNILDSEKEKKGIDIGKIMAGYLREKFEIESICGFVLKSELTGDEKKIWVMCIDAYLDINFITEKKDEYDLDLHKGMVIMVDNIPDTTMMSIILENNEYSQLIKIIENNKIIFSHKNTISERYLLY